MRILVAEDEPITRLTLVRQLQQWGHDVTAAEDGQRGWELFAAGQFDLIITDWEMPRLSGVELVRRIREQRQPAYTYVIILTSRSEKSDVVQAIEAGADDFLSKPFDRNELRVRILAGERVLRLERALAAHNQELREANERIRGGLRAAARVQQSMLPRQNILTSHARTAWKYIPADELCGDAIGLHLIDDRYLVAYVLDVSGHGVPAALLSVSAMYAMEPIAPETSVIRVTSSPHAELGTVQRPARVAEELNRRFRASDNDGRYLTMLLCVLDTFDGRLHIASAGHPPPFVLRGGELIAVPDAGGLPIAVADDAPYDDACLQLQPGDRMCLVSDGVLEQFDAARNEQYQAQRLAHNLCRTSALSPEDVVATVVNEIAAWSGTENQFADDVSIVVIDWLG